MSERVDYATAGVGDAARLRESLDFGSAWTRSEARRAWGWNERRFRAAIAELREAGYPVISTSGLGSVYRKARVRAEVEDFLDREIRSRIGKLSGQARAMEAHLGDYFAPTQQRLVV